MRHRLALALLVLALPATAAAQSQVWWGASTDDSGTNAANDVLGWVGTDGIGAQTAFTLPMTGGGAEAQPSGLAADLATGRVYWLDYRQRIIYRANFDGTERSPVTETWTVGDGSDNPYGLARDPETDRLYWSGFLDKIQVINADGSGKAMLYDNPANSDWISSLAIAPRANRIYWGNSHANQPDSNLIGVARLDGSGVLAPINPVQCAAVNSIFSLAVDEDAGFIYRVGQLVSNGNYAIQRYRLDDGACTTLFQRGGVIKGVALDPDHNRLIYGGWTDGNLGWVDLADPVQGGNLTTGAVPTDYLSTPMVLVAPRADSAPALGASSTTAGATLSCGDVNWGESQPGMNLFRDPASYAVTWERNGVVVPDVAAPTLVAAEAGTWRCLRSATNARGTTVAASPATVLTAAVPGTGSGDTPPATPSTNPGTTPASTARLVGRLQVRRTGAARAALTARIQLTAGNWSLRVVRGTRTLRLLPGSRIAATTLARAGSSAPVRMTSAGVVTVRVRIAGPARGLALRLVPASGSAITLR